MLKILTEKKKKIYNLIQKRLEDEEKLDNLYDELIILRLKIANAGLIIIEIICFLQWEDLIISQKIVLIFIMQFLKNRPNNNLI